MSAIDNQALGWVQLQAELEFDASRLATLDEWLEEDTRHRGAFVRAIVISNAISQAVAHRNLYPCDDPYELRSSHLNRGHLERRKLLQLGGLAAGLALIGFGVSMNFSQTSKVLETAKGEARRVTLPDTSFANINSDSKLRVQLTSEMRLITLSRGEVWFEVAKDKTKPFVVQAGDVQVCAVGTAFSVRRLAHAAEVLVTEGTVEVRTGVARARLAAGQHSVVPNLASVIELVQAPDEVERRLAWRRGKLVFTRQTLGEAVAEFNRYSLKRIVIADPSLERTRIVGQYQLDAPEQFARDIGTYLNVPVEITQESIVIGTSKASKNSII
jgi:transmembrane sensor